MTSDRKAAIAAYKERKTFAGVFVIRCKASPQAAWATHGPDSLTFEECERLEEEETSCIRDALLKERALHWRKELAAEAV